ncbi:Uncharacterised protein [Mycobacteroides abscessus]|nr:Uncharacterised protein [Mycobacteroides abscessus]SHT79550.1 Uncharacterised protein [Mycobacteroides abscessus subsp. abscessus]SLG85506.1 Uncharacterised protein [Mycobacteroides abscessus subsp. abscessus]
MRRTPGSSSVKYCSKSCTVGASNASTAAIRGDGGCSASIVMAVVTRVAGALAPSSSG